jgi:hypothetical protein
MAITTVAMTLLSFERPFDFGYHGKRAVGGSRRHHTLIKRARMPQFRRIVMLVLALVVTRDASAQYPAVASRDSSNLAVLDQSIEDAITNKDVAFLDSLLLPTFRWTHFGGPNPVESRERFLAGVGAPPARHKRQRPSEEPTRVPSADGAARSGRPAA